MRKSLSTHKTQYTSIKEAQLLLINVAWKNWGKHILDILEPPNGGHWKHRLDYHKYGYRARHMTSMPKNMSRP